MKTIIITGGANGLGEELVNICHLNGFYVYNIDKDFAKLNELEKKYKINYKSFCGDVSDENFVKSAVESISEERQIDALINCAGSPSFKLPKNYSDEDFNLCFEGVKGMIYFTAAVLNHMEKHGGKIINIMSSASLRGNPKESVYCAAKWAERGYTESLKVAYSGSNIQVYGVYPGGINTDFYKNSRDYVSIEKQNTFMSPKELATVIFNNTFSSLNLIVEDLIINRIKKA